MDLGDLPGELLTEIARRLPCRADLVALTAALRRPIAPPAPHPALPWLLVPHSSPPVLAPGEARTARFACIGCGGPHDLRVPEEFAAGRFFGSYPPGWVFLAGAQDSEHALINLYTRTRALLPDFLFLAEDATRQRRRMVMVAAALSAKPLDPGEICFGAAIVGTPFDSDINNGAPVFALWVLNRTACDERPVAHGFRIAVAAGLQQQNLVLEDVVYHRGAFYFLTSEEQVVAVHVVVDDHDQRLLARQQVIEHRRAANPQGVLVSGRYLVASHGEWAMLVRFHLAGVGGRVPGPAMRVVMYGGQIHHGDAFRTWTEAPAESLRGLIVFAARGCSSSFEDPDGLYKLNPVVRYLDDRDARDMRIIVEKNPRLRDYRCNDTPGFGWPPAAYHLYRIWVD
ncbi:hypothetical protein VPH35_011496 [Triticum aestivum]